jgi:hypothetical protein
LWVNGAMIFSKKKRRRRRRKKESTAINSIGLKTMMNFNLHRELNIY